MNFKTVLNESSLLILLNYPYTTRSVFLTRLNQKDEYEKFLPLICYSYLETLCSVGTATGNFVN